MSNWPLMPTIRERINREFQQQGERLRPALAALLTPMAAHNFVPRGVTDLAVYRRIAASLLVCLSAGHCWAGSKRALAASCAKTISFRRSDRPSQYHSLNASDRDVPESSGDAFPHSIDPGPGSGKF